MQVERADSGISLSELKAQLCSNHWLCELGQVTSLSVHLFPPLENEGFFEGHVSRSMSST